MRLTAIALLIALAACGKTEHWQPVGVWEASSLFCIIYPDGHATVHCPGEKDLRVVHNGPNGWCTCDESVNPKRARK